MDLEAKHEHSSSSDSTLQATVIYPLPLNLSLDQYLRRLGLILGGDFIGAGAGDGERDLAFNFPDSKHIYDFIDIVLKTSECQVLVFKLDEDESFIEDETTTVTVPDWVNTVETLWEWTSSKLHNKSSNEALQSTAPIDTDVPPL